MADTNYFERIDGPTPNGGAYSIMYFFDGQGNPVPKGEAVEARCVEFDKKGEAIYTTYAIIEEE